jgi:hypothetical protein
LVQAGRSYNQLRDTRPVFGRFKSQILRFHFDREVRRSRISVVYHVRQTQMQRVEGNRGLHGLRKLNHLLLSFIDRGVRVWRIISSLSYRPQIRIAHGYPNAAKLAIGVNLLRLIR